MRLDILLYGIMITIFSFMIELYPENFSIGIIIGMALVMIIIGIFDKEKFANYGDEKK